MKFWPGWRAAGGAIAVLAACFSTSCRDEPVKDQPGAGTEARAAEYGTDALWELSPPDASLAVVISGGALEPARAGLTIALAGLERQAATKALAARLRRELAAFPAPILDPGLKDKGVDPAGGAAYFVSDAGPAAVLSVPDRAKLLAATKGTSAGGVDRIGSWFCKPAKGRYLCAAKADQIDTLAKGGPYSPIDDWAAELRGDVEIHSAEMPAAVKGVLSAMGLVGSAGIRIGARLERGGGTIRAHVTGRATGALEHGRSGTPTKLEVDKDQAPTGLFVVQSAKLGPGSLFGAMANHVATKLPGGVDAGSLVASLDGDAIGWALPGEAARFAIRIGLAVEEPMKQVLARCEALGSVLPVGVGVAKRGNVCSLSFDLSALFPDKGMKGTLEAALWVEASALRVEIGGPATSSETPARADFPREVVERPQLYSSWGRGSLVGSPSIAALTAMSDDAEVTRALLHWLYRINELGMSLRVEEDGVHAAVHVRTLWANPPSLVAEVEKVIDQASERGGDARAGLAAAAGRFPDSPLARDLRGGGGGLMVQILPMVAVLAISDLATARAEEQTRVAMGDSPAAVAARKRAVKLAERKGSLTIGLFRGVIRASPHCAKMAAFARRYRASHKAELIRLNQQFDATPVAYRELMIKTHEKHVTPLAPDFFAATRVCEKDAEFRASMEAP